LFSSQFLSFSHFFGGMGLRMKLEEKGPKVPVIFVTADDDQKTRAKARELNAAGFFRKPVDGPALLDAIAWALET
jgi:FixJ family two-component response regulator